MQNTTINLSLLKANVINSKYEKFLVLEGSCDLTIEDQVFQLFQGDHLYIPTHVHYHIKTTSNGFCKALVEGNTNFQFKRVLVFA